MPASASAREIGFLSKGPLAYFNFRRDAACRVSLRGGGGLAPSQQVGSAARKTILWQPKILEKLTAPKLFKKGVGVACDQRVEQSTGGRADTKDGVSIWFPVFAGFILAEFRLRYWVEACGLAIIGGRLLVGVYWLASIS